MDEDGTWSPSLSELGGIIYSPPEGIQAPRLDRAHAAPDVSSFEFDDGERTYLSWRTRDGSTSASPASRHFATAPDDEAPIEEIVRHLHEGLCLPGTPSDYHFALQRVIDALWKRRRTDPEAVAPLEGLCLLDIAIVEAYPDPFRTGDRFVSMTSTHLLVSLYEHAGDLDAALTLARRVDPFLNGTGEVERLEEKRSRLAEEETP